MTSFSPASKIGSIQHLSEISVLYAADKVLDRFHFRSPDPHNRTDSGPSVDGQPESDAHHPAFPAPQADSSSSSLAHDR